MSPKDDEEFFGFEEDELEDENFEEEDIWGGCDLEDDEDFDDLEDLD